MKLRSDQNVAPEKCDEFFNKKIYRIKDVAYLMGVSTGHIYNLIATGKRTKRKTIPYRKKGKLLFFIPDEILDWIHEGE